MPFRSTLTATVFLNATPLSQVGYSKIPYCSPSVCSARHFKHPFNISAALPPSIPVKKGTIYPVNPDDGEKLKAPTEDSVQVTDVIVQLDDGPVTCLPDVHTHRSSNARVYGTIDNINENWVEGSQVVVFGHGFSQVPNNYSSMLRRLAVLGFIIISPQVWLLDTIWPWVSVDTVPWYAGPPAKLQTALLIDVARSVQMMHRLGARSVHVLGHSMGAAMLLAYGRYVPKQYIQSMALLAPAVRASKVTPLNPYVTIYPWWRFKGDDNLTELAKDLGSFSLFILQGSCDSIVSAKDTSKVFNHFSDRNGLSGEGVINGGNHVKFEDTLSVDITQIPILDLLERLLFGIINLLLLNWDLFGSESQLQTTKALLEVWFKNVESMSPELIKPAIESTDVNDSLDYEWTGSSIREA